MSAGDRLLLFVAIFFWLLLADLSFLTSVRGTFLIFLASSNTGRHSEKESRGSQPPSKASTIWVLSIAHQRFDCVSFDFLLLTGKSAWPSVAILQTRLSDHDFGGGVKEVCLVQVELDSDRLSQMIKVLPVYPRNQISGTGFEVDQRF
jgi:hypothetical protein